MTHYKTWFSFFMLLAVLMVAAPRQLAQPKSVQQVLLDFTVQDKEREPKGYFVHQLSCIDRMCTLTILYLPQCDQLEGAFVPGVSTYSTREDGLDVSDLDGVLLVKVRMGGVFGVRESTFRIGYAKRYPGNEIATKITQFSGVGAEDSDTSKRVQTWQWVPLRGENRFIKVGLDCRVALPSIPLDHSER